MGNGTSRSTTAEQGVHGELDTTWVRRSLVAALEDQKAIVHHGHVRCERDRTAPQARDDAAEAYRLRSRTLVVGMRAAMLVGLAVDLVVALYVLTQVPPGTTISYTRLSREWQLPIVGLGLFPALILGLWVRSRKAPDEDLPPVERVILVVGLPLLLLVLVGGQFVLGHAYLQAGQPT